MTPLIVYITAANREEAESIAERLVEERLAACCTLTENVTSIYRWEGKIERAGETLITVKTMSSRYRKLERRVLELHSYDTPEILAIETFAGNSDYLLWIQNMTAEESTGL